MSSESDSEEFESAEEDLSDFEDNKKNVQTEITSKNKLKTEDNAHVEELNCDDRSKSSENINSISCESIPQPILNPNNLSIDQDNSGISKSEATADDISANSASFLVAATSSAIENKLDNLNEQNIYSENDCIDESNSVYGSTETQQLESKNKDHTKDLPVKSPSPSQSIQNVSENKIEKLVTANLSQDLNEETKSVEKNSVKHDNSQSEDKESSIKCENISEKRIVEKSTQSEARTSEKIIKTKKLGTKISKSSVHQSCEKSKPSLRIEQVLESSAPDISDQQDTSTMKKTCEIVSSSSIDYKQEITGNMERQVSNILPAAE